MKTMKTTGRIFALLLTLAMILSYVTVTAAAADADNDTTGKYVLVSSVGELKSGGSYLLVLNRTHIMLPAVVSKNERTGLDLESSSAFGSDFVSGDYGEKEWTLTQTDGGWYLQKGQTRALVTRMTDNNNSAHVTLSETDGTVFKIGGSAGAFTFASASGASSGFVLNYNTSRGLVNGFYSNPASFAVFMRDDGAEAPEPEPEPEPEPDPDPADGIIVLAGSDFQHTGGNTTGQGVVSGIFDAMKADGINRAHGLLFCGDYDYATIGNASATLAGVNAFKTVASKMVNAENLVLVQGNHDVYEGSGLSASGNNDPESGEYGVFVINNKDYMWYNNDETTIKYTAQSLIDYLNRKLAVGYGKPIFVVSHLPLHYSMRTKNDGDGQYANYIFNALNEAGAKGLNIVFLFGHDHSNGWDDYLGGSNIYLQKGDDILIAQASRTEFKKETLNFTYANAGYVGYYNNHNGLKTTLSMTAFRIKDGQITVGRYNSSGTCDLKIAGVTNTYKNESGYDPDPAVYTSPQTITLTAVTDRTPIDDLIELPTPEGKQYQRVSSASDLTDGGKYLLVYTGSPSSLMLPSVVTKSNNSGARIGFDLQEAAGFGEPTVCGDYTDGEWTFTAAPGGWLIGNGEKYAKFTNTQNTAITATLEDEGDVFTVSGSGTYTFYSNGTTFNYNARGLINGFPNAPAKFLLYKFTGYSVLSVENGEILAADGDQITDGKSTLVKEGAAVTLKAAVPPEGSTFEKWTVLEGRVTLSDASDPSATFIMPASAVRIAASYREEGGGECDHIGEWVVEVEPTCTESGRKIKRCTVCSEILETETIDPTGHVEGKWEIEVEPTAEREGVRVRKCTVCNTELARETIAKLYSNPFIDVNEEGWYGAAVRFVVTEGLMDGVSTTEFKPNGNMTRGMLVTVLWRIDGKPAASGENPFGDVPSGKYYTDAVIWASANDIVNGTSVGSFSPNHNITREQLAAILYRYAAKNGRDTDARADLTEFTDGESTSAYAKEALSWAYAQALITGSKAGDQVLLNPKGSASRAQVATILMRYHDTEKKAYTT